MLKKLTTLILLIATAVLPALAEIPIGWKQFSPPGKDFNVLMPDKPHRKLENMMGQQAIMYQQLSDGVAYAVLDGIYVNPRKKEQAQTDLYEQAIAAAEAKFTSSETEPVERVETDETGEGWHGKKVVFKTADRVLLTMLVAISNADDVVYTLYANAGEDQFNVLQFFKSFVVDPDRATRSHLDLTKSVGIGSFVNVIYTISLIVLAAIAVYIGVSIIRSRNKRD